MKKVRPILIAFLISLGTSFVFPLVALAQEFGCGAYGGGSFGEGECGGEVADTGLDIWLYRIIGIALIVLAVFIVVRVSRKRK